jgi:peptidoglycan/xylan/chitin deacetylase (PgdA/CDA1 family)
MKFSLMSRVAQKIGRLTPVNLVKSKLTAPIASISFDDIPHSAARIGAPILEAADLRGTFYACGNHSGESFDGKPQHSVDDLIRLHEAGHEVACHTFAHPDVTRLNNAARYQDLTLNRDFMQQNVGDVALSSFAYPYGAVSLPAKLFYAKRFFTCRGVYGGVNSGIMDFGELLAVGIERRQHDMGRVREMIEEAKAKNGWIIFFTHDVGPEPSDYGCRPKDLEDVIQALSDARINTLTVKAAASAVLFS